MAIWRSGEIDLDMEGKSKYVEVVRDIIYYKNKRLYKVVFEERIDD